MINQLGQPHHAAAVQPCRNDKKVQSRGENAAAGKDPCHLQKMIFLVHSLFLSLNDFFCSGFSPAQFACFMLRLIRFFFSSTSSTVTFTISPTDTTSDGCLMNLFDTCEICTSPS